MYGIFLDLETTGLDSTKHRVLELAFKVIDLATGKEVLSFDSFVHQPADVWEQSDPESLAVNGMSSDQTSEGKTEAFLADTIVEKMQALGISRKNAVFICQNPSFDRAFFSQIIPTYRQEKLLWPYHWLDLASMYWANYIRDLPAQPDKSALEDIRLSKNIIARAHGLPEEATPHRAMNGVEHLIACYEKVVGWPKT